MIWKLLAIAFGAGFVSLAMVVAWQLVARARLRRRFAGIHDIERELSARRQACDVELAVRLAAFEAEVAARRRAVDAALAGQTAEIELGRRNATRELADTMRRTTELQERYASAKGVYDRLRAELSALEQTSDDLSYGLYSPIFNFASPDDYKRRLIEVRDQQRALVRDDLAVTCGAGDSRRDLTRSPQLDGELQKQYAKLLVRAFNSECDAVAAKVTWNNAARMIERVKHAFEAINRLGSALHCELAKPYRELKLEELRLEHEHEQKRRDQQEEQRALREQQREDAHVQQALERARSEAEDEEAYAQRALDQAYLELAAAPPTEIQPWRARIAMIEAELRDARQRKERAILRVDQTRAGHIYVLSNLGSFGETVYKIGVTRRDDPLERVRELGAALPFDFDLHAMVPVQDAPALETRLHQQFHHRRVNLVDLQRGYFQVTLDEIEAFIRSQGIAIEVTRLPEARQYRETVELRRRASERANPRQVHDSDGYAFPASR